MADKEAPEGEDPKNIPLEQRIEHKVDLLFRVLVSLIIFDVNDSSLHTCFQM